VSSSERESTLTVDHHIFYKNTSKTINADIERERQAVMEEIEELRRM